MDVLSFYTEGVGAEVVATRRARFCLLARSKERTIEDFITLLPGGFCLYCHEDSNYKCCFHARSVGRRDTRLVTQRGCANKT